MATLKAPEPAQQSKETIKVDVIRIKGPPEKVDAKQFAQAMDILKKNFPPSEIESPEQFMGYFIDEAADTWHFHVAVDPESGKIAGMACFSFFEETGVVMYNLIAVDAEYRQMGVASQLVDGMIAETSAGARKDVGVTYVMGEIEQPDRSIDGEEGRMRNEIRPKFHDSTTKLSALQKPDGTVVKYILPIMASEEERREAESEGNPLSEEELMFTLRPIRNAGSGTIPMREAGELLYWFYKDYLAAECPDMLESDANRLLAKALSELAGVEITEAEISGKGRAVLSKIPDNGSLRLIGISESEGK